MENHQSTQLFYGPHSFWKENIADRVKVWGSNVLKCCLKITKVDLRKKGFKMRWAMSLTPLSPSPKEEHCGLPQTKWVTSPTWGIPPPGKQALSHEI